MNRLKFDLYSKIIVNNLFLPPDLNVLFNLLSVAWEKKLKRTMLMSSPVSAVLYINKNCNFSCDFCYNKDILNQSPISSEIFSEDDMKKFLNSRYGKDVLRVALMGGEPFLNKNIFKLIKAAKERRKIINIVSNASLIQEDTARKIVDSRLDAIGLSLYDNNIPDIIRSVKLFNDYGVNYWVQTVVDATKINEVESKILFAKENGIRNFILSNYNPYFNSEYSKMLMDNGTDLVKMIGELKSKYAGELNIIWPSILPSRPDFGKKQCALPFTYIHLDKDGLIGPCCYRYPKEKYGNLYENGWNSEYNRALRANMLSSEAPMDECTNCENIHRSLYF